MRSIHITVDLEARLRQKLREVMKPPTGTQIVSDRLYHSGYRAALEWVIEQAGLEIDTRRVPTTSAKEFTYDRHD